MSESNEGQQKSDLSECSNVMDNLEDDAEDYIQTSQPLGFQSSSRDTPVTGSAVTDPVEMNVSTIDETLPFAENMMSTPVGNTSNDFIPESENPIKRKINIGSEEFSKKRLDLDESSIIKATPDIFSNESQLHDLTEASQLKVPESPSIFESPSDSLVPESPVHTSRVSGSDRSCAMFSGSEKCRVLEETALEDSLQDTTADFCESERTNLELSVSEFQDESRADTEEILTDKQSPTRVSEVSSDNIKETMLEKKMQCQEMKLDDTIDADDIEYFKSHSTEKIVEEENTNPTLTVTEGLMSTIDVNSQTTSTPTDHNRGLSGSTLKGVLKLIADEEIDRLQKHSTPENPLSKSPKINESASSIENGTPPLQDDTKSSEINFTVHLQVDCQIILDSPQGKPISKKIIGVKEICKKQPKQIFLEPSSDSSNKTKRFSSSSSGSVYSDKTGLPYALPGRSLPTSAVRENSSSSSVDLVKHIQIVERHFWENEYMIPMAIDEITPYFIEQHKAGEQCPSKGVGKRKLSLRLRKKNLWNKALDNVLESSLTEPSSGNSSYDQLQSVKKMVDPKPVEIPTIGDIRPTTPDDTPPEGTAIELKQETAEKNVVETPVKEQDGLVDSLMTEGLPVFARWTDKRYYPGKLKCKAKYDRWEVEFDDDTEKVIREDLILPLDWLVKGELVFALVGEKYLSGKISEIIREEEITFKIELDDTNEEVTVKKSDLCLNDVMAGIIREKFKPSNKANPPVMSCDIDFDNVVVGKRVREQRTPIRTATTALQPGSSTAKKRRGLKADEEGGKQTPTKKATPLSKADLQSGKKIRSSTKKTRKSDLPEGADSVEDPKPEYDLPSTSKETPPKSETKSEGKKKRGRTFKNDDSNKEVKKCESSSKKSKQSEESSNAANSASQKKGKSSSKVLITEFNEADVAGTVTTRSVESGETEKQSTGKKVVKIQKAKEEKPPSKSVTRSVRSKPVANVQEGKGRKKNR